MLLCCFVVVFFYRLKAISHLLEYKLLLKVNQEIFTNRALADDVDALTLMLVVSLPYQL